MANKNTQLFDKILGDDTNPSGQSSSARKATSSPRRVTDRTNYLTELRDGAVEEKVLRWVEPERCRMWERHNRRYELLNEMNCADLIEGFKAQGRQEFPAMVRQLKDDPDYDYEVISGARRHWTTTWLRANNYQDYKFLIEIRELTDEQAFRLSDVENRDRQDISDYERAADYLRALEVYYNGQQKAMAERLQSSEAWLSRFLDLARLPDEIVGAYQDVTHIKLRHAMELKPLLKDRAMRARVIAEAKKIGSEQQAARKQNTTQIDGAGVMRALKAAAVHKTKPKTGKAAKLAEYKAETGKRMLDVTRQGKGDLMLNIAINSGAKPKELKAAVMEAIEQFYAG